jgi:Fe-S-cluster containining protein
VTAEAAPPCLACGTCCFSTLETYARLDGADHARLAERAEELTIFIGNRCYMKMQGGHCAALVVDVATRRFVCNVYESRPAVCRQLERGSPACSGEIQAKGTRPGALLESLDRRLRGT